MPYEENLYVTKKYFGEKMCDVEFFVITFA